MEDIVFEGRNKAYGAYDLRKRYPRYLLRALIWATTLFTVVFILLFIVQYAQRDRVHVDYRSQMLDVKTEKILGLPLPKSVSLQEEKKYKTNAGIQNEQKEVIKTPIKQVEIQESNVQSRDQITSTNNDNAQKTGGKAGDSVTSYVFERLITASEDTLGTEEYTSEIYFNVDQDAHFPGGVDSLHAFMRRTIIPSDYAIRNQVRGIVYLLILVESDGKISEYKVYRGIEATCDASVLKAFQDSPAWIPARKKGKKVRQRLIVGIPYIYDQ